MDQFDEDFLRNNRVLMHLSPRFVYLDHKLKTYFKNKIFCTNDFGIEILTDLKDRNHSLTVKHQISIVIDCMDNPKKSFSL